MKTFQNCYESATQPVNSRRCRFFMAILKAFILCWP